jgi:glycosyltransferase involved in cell wall biosynthesis
MINVLVVSGTEPKETRVLVEGVQRFRDAGATVTLACYYDPAVVDVPAGLAEVIGFVQNSDEDRRFRKALRRAESTRKLWLHARRHPRLRRVARRADVLVAADPNAVYLVWECAQRNAGADAVYGMAAALRAAQARQDGRSAPATTLLRRAVVGRVGIVVRATRRFAIRAARALYRRATGTTLMRFGPAAQAWRVVLALPGLPDRVRVRLGVSVHRSMVAAGREALARRTSSGAAARMRDPQSRARLLSRQATVVMQLGRVPAGLAEAMSAHLALADRHLAGNNPKKAATNLADALTLAANRVLHFDGLTSPLAEDPARFLAPFRASTAAARLAAPRGRATPPAAPPTDRPHRLLLATATNDNFLGEIRERYSAMPGVEVRFVDVDVNDGRRKLGSGALAIQEHVLAGHSAYGTTVEAWLRPYLDWADTVFIDWCVVTAGLFTLLDPGTARIIVRLHSFEVFGPWPHLVDFSRVDDMVFVSEHLRDLAAAAHPRLTGEHGPRQWVIPNAMELRRFVRDKPATARFNLGLVGVGAVAKDSRWAVEVLRLLREQDRRYKLHMIGAPLNERTSAAAAQYGRLLREDLAELEPAGAVVNVGQTADVPAALRDVGVILSSSVRESFHCGFVEGAASGAVPVARDWPFFAGKPNGARTLFPPDWVVDTPEEAAKRILALTATEPEWREAGQAASAHALATWDWSVTSRRFDELLLTPPR